MRQEADCIFCKIIKGEIPSSRVYEDEGHVAFADISPKAPVHYLIVSKEHSPRLDEMVQEDGTEAVGALFRAAVRAAEANALADYRLVVNVGAGAGQEVFHTHVHILSGWPQRAGPVG